MPTKDWFLKLIHGQPHLEIGRSGHVYLRRWNLIPQNAWCNIFLHQFLRDDDDRALHDHPWDFISVMLQGSYQERLSRVVGFRTVHGVQYDQCEDQIVNRRAPSIGCRYATDRHRIVLPRDHQGNPIPCWTIIITGPWQRVWGFWCPKGFVPYREFVDPTDEGKVGKGCG
jgi:hypothetical protein